MVQRETVNQPLWVRYIRETVSRRLALQGFAAFPRGIYRLTAKPDRGGTGTGQRRASWILVGFVDLARGSPELLKNNIIACNRRSYEPSGEPQESVEQHTRAKSHESARATCNNYASTNMRRCDFLRGLSHATAR